MDEMKTTVRTLTFSTNYVPPSPFASKSGGSRPPSSYGSADPGPNQLPFDGRVVCLLIRSSDSKDQAVKHRDADTITCYRHISTSWPTVSSRVEAVDTWRVLVCRVRRVISTTHDVDLAVHLHNTYSTQLTLQRNIKTAEQRTIIQQYVTQRGGAWAGCGPSQSQSPPRCIKCNSPPINSQCTNFVSFDVAV